MMYLNTTTLSYKNKIPFIPVTVKYIFRSHQDIPYRKSSPSIDSPDSFF